MAQLAIAAVGAVAGNFIGIGASAGWLIGSFIGGQLFAKGQKTEGPRLSDLSVQSSTEGAPIPVYYGEMRGAGNMIWSSGIRETKTKKKTGGKGMGGSSSHTTYTYDASFAIALCEGPIAGIRRIWADGKLIYQNATGTDAATLFVSKKKARGINFYRGTETQTADSVIAAHVGAANAPAYRGTAYIVFDRLQLADFGNRIPNITAEVIVGAEGDYLWRVNTWPQEFSTTQAEFVNGIVRVIARETVSGANVRRRVIEYDMNGNKLRDTYGPTVAFPSGTTNEATSVQGRPRIARYQRSAQNIVNAQHWILDDHIVAQDISMGQFGDSRSFLTTNPNAVFLNGYIFASVSNLDMDNVTRRAANGVARWPVSNGFTPSPTPDKFNDLASAGYCTPRGTSSWVVRRICPTDEGTLLFYIHSDNVIAFHILEFDIDLNFIKGYTLASGYVDVAWGVRNGRFLVSVSGSADGYNDLRLYEEQTSGVYTQIKQISNFAGAQPGGLILSLGNGLLLAANGVFSIYPAVGSSSVTVGDVAADICRRCGLVPGQYDVSALTDSIKGYAWTPRTGRAAIEPLGQCFFFDAAEIDGAIKFVRRPGTVQAAITSDDIGAGIERPAQSLVDRTRAQELELPGTISIGYLDSENDYQPGLQQASRLSTLSRHTVSLEVAIAMSSTKAAQVAEVLLRNAWGERESFALDVPRKFARLDPTDLVTLPDGSTARIVMTNYADPHVVSMRAVREVSSAYSPVSVGNAPGSANPQTVAIKGPTRLEFMNLPPLRDTDRGAGFYLAACGFYSGWTGCQVLRSADGGSSYDDVTTIFDDAIIGNATTALGPIEGGELIGGRSVTIDILTPGGTLSGVTEAQLLAGANVALLGDEILQFQYATLNVDGTYTLSGLLRGRLGTEAAASTHASGERFVLLDSAVRWVDESAANVGISFDYRVISIGDALDDGLDDVFASTGRARQNPAPTSLTGAIDYLTGEWDLSWYRRNRVSWWFQASGDLQLDAEPEAYDVEIYSTAGVLVRTERVSSRAYAYTEAKQIADHGAAVAEFNVTVYQISEDGVTRGLPATANIRHSRRGRYASLMRVIGPALYWRSIFDATPDDVGPNNYDGTSSGTVSTNQADTGITVEPAVHRSALLGGGYLQRADSGSSALDITEQQITLSCWIKFTATGTDLAIMGKWDSLTATDQAYLLSTGTVAGSLRFRVRTATGTPSVQHNGSYNDGAWHHVVAVANRGTMTLYVDGVQRAQTTGNAADAIQSGAANFRAGQTSNGAAAWSGSITDIAIFAKVLPASLVADLYATATGAT